jgi:hypothetical protein
VGTAGRAVRNSVVPDLIRAFVSSTCRDLKAPRPSVIGGIAVHANRVPSGTKEALAGAIELLAAGYPPPA